jgi:O-acetylhomoserine/O-acetylserine sulfhydrylase-like pyridoxal-dependent enzyme
MGFSTIAIHAGNEPDSATGAVTVPIYQTSTYAQESLGKHKGLNTRERKIRRGSH